MSEGSYEMRMVVVEPTPPRQISTPLAPLVTNDRTKHIPNSTPLASMASNGAVQSVPMRAPVASPHSVVANRHPMSSQPHHNHPHNVIREYSNVTENVIRRKKMVEEMVEKTIVVPEKVCREEEYDEVEMVRENVIEVERPVIKNVYVEVPEVVHHEEIVEVEETRIEEKLVHVDKVEYQEVINYVPKIEQVERIVEVEVIEYVEIEVEKIVEVPEYREEIVIVEKPMPRYVDKPKQVTVDIRVEARVDRVTPVPVELVTEQEFDLPAITSIYSKIQVPLYVPRFIEVPVPAEMLTEASLKAAEKLLARIESVNRMEYPSLCEIEELAGEAKNFQLDVEGDAGVRFERLTSQLNTSAVVVNTNAGDVIGRKVSMTVTTRNEL